MDTVNDQQHFISIPLNTLVPDQAVGIKMYLNTGKERYALFLSEKTILTSAKIEQLEENGVKHLYINPQKHSSYLNYLKKNLRKILQNSMLSDNDRAEIAYETASQITKELFSQPSVEAIEKTREVVDCIIETICQTPNASRLLMMITSQDYYTYTHSINVGIYAVSMLCELTPSLNIRELKTLGLGFFLHDLGKARIPKSILNKKGPLSHQEWELMTQHPEIGVELAHSLKINDPMIDQIILYHHERPSGTGYPRGLDSDEIPRPAKICALCDVFDALTTNRSYKGALSTFEALKVMKNETPEHFESEMLYKFIHLFRESPW